MFELAVALESLAEEDVREKRAKAPESILRLRFGFTAAEARVAGQLAEGLSYADVAELLGVSYHTVHTHVKAIHAKAGVKSNGRLLAWMGHLSERRSDSQ